MLSILNRCCAVFLCSGLLFSHSTLTLAASLSPSPDRTDQVLIDMSSAFSHNDRKKLSQLLPQAKGHILEPWAAYWELRVRLGDASDSEIKEFLNKYLPGRPDAL